MQGQHRIRPTGVTANPRATTPDHPASDYESAATEHVTHVASNADVAANVTTAAPTEPSDGRENRRYVVWALAADVAIVLVCLVLLMLRNADLADGFVDSPTVPIGISIGAALMLVAIVTFLGFYTASPPTKGLQDASMRNAIVATFVVFYLVLLTFLLIAPNFRGQLEIGDGAIIAGQSIVTEEEREATQASLDFGVEIFNGFTTFLTIIIGFYFAAQVGQSLVNALVGKKVDAS